MNKVRNTTYSVNIGLEIMALQCPQAMLGYGGHQAYPSRLGLVMILFGV